VKIDGAKDQSQHVSNIKQQFDLNPRDFNKVLDAQTKRFLDKLQYDLRQKVFFLSIQSFTIESDLIGVLIFLGFDHQGSHRSS
jgi:hypothetical protein